jgi:hypothetical protein
MGGGSGETENCGFQNFNLVRKPAEILLVLDRSASMLDEPDGSSGSVSKWNLVVPALTEVIAATDTSVAWGMKTFPEGDRAGECTATSVTSKIDVPVAPMNAAVVNAQIQNTSAEGDGTPTGDAMKQAVTYMQSLTSTNPKYFLLATDGEPSCAGTTKGGSAARPYAVSAVSAALAAGFHTFVVGVATTKDSASQALNDMAVAGGEARPDPNPLATKYYLANTKDELVTSLRTITGEVAKSCIFTLDPPPPAPNFIAVKVSSENAPRSSTDGWEYTGTDYKSLEVFGSWCDRIKNQAADKVEIIYGCLNVPPR